MTVTGLLKAKVSPLSSVKIEDSHHAAAGFGLEGRILY